jgi:hypothetical protein
MYVCTPNAEAPMRTRLMTSANAKTLPSMFHMTRNRLCKGATGSNISTLCQQGMDSPFSAPEHSAARTSAAQLLFHLSGRLVQFVYIQNFKGSQCAPQSHDIWPGDIMGHSSPKHSFNFLAGVEGLEHSQPGKRRSYVVPERNDHGQMVVWCPNHHDQISWPCESIGIDVHRR